MSEPGEDFYSVDEAARILKLTPGRIRQMLRAGELEAHWDEPGGRRSGLAM
jgi:excisionase family DNA binding protein